MGLMLQACLQSIGGGEDSSHAPETQQPSRQAQSQQVNSSATPTQAHPSRVHVVGHLVVVPATISPEQLAES